MKVYEKTLEGIKENSSARHHLSGRIFPFYTREPERPKYKDDFNEIVGMISRISIGKNPVVDNIYDEYIDNILDSINFDSDDRKNFEIKDIFKLDFENMNKPYMFLYKSVKQNNKKEKSELKGKKLLAYYIVKVFELDNNKNWINYINNKEADNIYEELIINNLPELPELDTKYPNIHVYNKEILPVFNRDLNILIKNENMFFNNIGLFFSYYYFQYIIQELFNLVKKNRMIFKSYFAFSKEKVSSGRDCVKYGYKKIQELSKDTLLNCDLVDYLNILIDSDRYFPYSEIMNNKDISTELKYNLYQYNKNYAEIKKLNYKEVYELEDLVLQLKENLKQTNISKETTSRYRKTFDEFSNLTFIKRRGRYGYILNANEELIVMFVNIIIGDKNKILLRDLFLELEKRGLYFDKSSKNEIIKYFERINILEKLSDSGDAQYVRSIL